MAKRTQGAGTKPTSCNGPATGASECGRHVLAGGLCRGHHAQTRKGVELAPLRTYGKGEALERVSIRVPRGAAEWIAANPELAREILLRAARGES